MGRSEYRAGYVAMTKTGIATASAMTAGEREKE
jgi:hypothetical protein